MTWEYENLIRLGDEYLNENVDDCGISHLMIKLCSILNSWSDSIFFHH